MFHKFLTFILLVAGSDLVTVGQTITAKQFLLSIDWESVPKSFDVVLWIEISDYCGDVETVEAFVKSSGHRVILKWFHPKSYENITEFKETATKSRRLVKFVFLQNYDDFALLKGYKNPRESSQPLIIVTGTDTPINLTLSRLIKSLSTDESLLNNSTVEERFSLESQLYLHFIRKLASVTEEEELLSDNSSDYQLFEIYSIKNLTLIESIGLEESLNLIILFKSTARRTEFYGTQIIGVAEDSMTTSYEVAFDKTGNTLRFAGGSSVYIYHDLRDMLNFTEVAFIGSSIGSRDGRLTGRSYELLESGEADISVITVTMTPPRGRGLSFLQPMTPGEGIAAFFVQPPLYSLRNIFLSPFSTTLWATFLAVYGGIIISLTLFSLIKLHFFQDVTHNDGSFKDDSYMWAVGTMCQKGWPTTPDSESMRIVFFTGCFTGLVSYVAYSGAIVSSLSVKVVPVSQFQQLLPFGYEFYVHQASTTLQFLLRDLIEHYNLSQGISLTDTENEVRYMRGARKSFLSYPDLFYTTAYSLNETDRTLCQDISMVRTPGSTLRSAMFVKKGSDMRGVFSFRLIMIKERGFSRRYQKQAALKTKPVCSAASTAEIQSLGISDVFTALLLVAVGVGAAIFILALEGMVSFLRKKMKISKEDAYI